MKTKLTGYLNRIEEKYSVARKDWERIQRKLEEEEKRYNNIQWSNYTPQGMTAEHNKHEEIKTAIFNELENLRKSFSDSVETIRTDADKIFDRKYNYKSGEVDLKGVALLQSQGLKNVDIVNIANDYYASGNYTMYFMCADKLIERGADVQSRNHQSAEEKAVSSFMGEANKKREREDHVIIDSMEYLCLHGLRNSRLLSDGTHKVHDEMYQKFKGQAEEVFTETSAPWD